MYRIMLADDEGIVIDSMKFIIDKEFGSECQVEYAKTGRSVIELAERFRPDIAVMDIQMPGINGIEAMREIQKFSPNTIFIVMSAYDKFDYAQEAIKLGVLEYINKPMERTKVVATLKRAMESIDADRRKRSEDLLIKEKLEIVEPIIESGFIYNVLLKEKFDYDIDSYRSILGIDVNYGYMMAFVCGDSQEGNHMTNAVGSSVRMSMHYNEVRDIIKENFQCKVGSVMANKIAVLVPYDDDTMDYNNRISLIDKARELVRTLRKQQDSSFRIGIGRVKPLVDLGESYSEALNALLVSDSSVAHSDDLPIGCDYEENYPIDIENKIFESVQKGDVDGTLSYADMFVNWMIENSNGNLNSVRLKTLEFAMRAESLAYLNGGWVYKFHSRDSYLTDIMNLSSKEEFITWFNDKLTVVCHNIQGKHEEKSNDVIKIAKDYIKDNFSKDISLDDVSRVVGISPYYFSKIFKEGCGENFIEYLTNIRIEKAKELLMESDRSMKEICMMCGYSDPNYFSRTFKKNVGITPTEYKDKGI